MRLWLCSILVFGLCACTKASTGVAEVPPSAGDAMPTPAVKAAPAAPGGPAAAVPLQLTARSFPLPGATGPVAVDYLVCDRARSRVWVPVGDTGSADVFDEATAAFTVVGGFATEEREARGKKRWAGPSAATVGDGFVYIGNRATSEVCAIEDKTLKVTNCLKLPTSTDGVAYVASSREVWVTTPRDHSLTVLDASKGDSPKPKLVIRTDGDPEGYALDSARGVFYTNLEDKDRTLAIDVRTHAVKATWSASCGPNGPRGIAVDEARNFVMVACTDGVRVLDAAHDGTLLGVLDTGLGVDNIDYGSTEKLLVVAAGKAARLTVARLSDLGEPVILALGVTAEGARNAVMDANGNVYVVDPGTARLLTFADPLH